MFFFWLIEINARLQVQLNFDLFGGRHLTISRSGFVWLKCEDSKSSLRKTQNKFMRHTFYRRAEGIKVFVSQSFREWLRILLLWDMVEPIWISLWPIDWSGWSANEQACILVLSRQVWHQFTESDGMEGMSGVRTMKIDSIETTANEGTSSIRALTPRSF